MGDLICFVILLANIFGCALCINSGLYLLLGLLIVNIFILFKALFGGYLTIL